MTCQRKFYLKIEEFKTHEFYTDDLIKSVSVTGIAISTLKCMAFELCFCLQNKLLSTDYIVCCKFDKSGIYFSAAILQRTKHVHYIFVCILKLQYQVNCIMYILIHSKLQAFRYGLLDAGVYSNSRQQLGLLFNDLQLCYTKCLSARKD